MSRPWSRSALAVTLLCACGGGGSGGGGGNGGPGPIVANDPLQLCVASEAAKYERMVTCSQVPRANVEEWKAVSDPFCRQTEPAIVEVRDGRATFDGAKAVACVTALRATGCDAEWLGYREDPACAGVVTGKSAAGEPCREDAGCAAGSFCRLAGACPGVCTPLAQAGASCVEAPCAAGLRCDATQTCVALADAGQSCTAGGCRPGLSCDGGTCQPRRPSGPCSSDEVCVASARCVARTCQPVVGREAACDSTAAETACGDGLLCHPDSNTCQPLVSQGQVCVLAAGREPLQCQSGYCDFVAGVCLRSKIEGEPCVGGTQTEGTECWGVCERNFCAGPPRACTLAGGLGN